MIAELIMRVLFAAGALTIAAVIAGQLFHPGWTKVDSSAAILGTVLVMLGVFASSAARAMGGL